jgi:hypothetical protein
MNLEMRIYQALLKLYPRAFRGEYGEEMTRVFQESLSSQGSSFRFWARTFWDVISSANRERISGGKTMRSQTPITLIGGVAALLYGLLIPVAVLLTMGAKTIPITSSNIWFYGSLELFCAVAIPGMAILASLKSITLKPTRIHIFGTLLSILSLVFSRWHVVVMLLPLVDLGVFSNPWFRSIATLGLPLGLLCMALGQVGQGGFGQPPTIAKVLIGMAALLLLSYVPINWLINNMPDADAQPLLIFVFCLVQLPWIGLGWLLLSSRQPHSTQARMA